MIVSSMTQLCKDYKGLHGKVTEIIEFGKKNGINVESYGDYDSDEFKRVIDILYSNGQSSTIKIGTPFVKVVRSVGKPREFRFKVQVAKRKVNKHLVRVNGEVKIQSELLKKLKEFSKKKTDTKLKSECIKLKKSLSNTSFIERWIKKSSTLTHLLKTL